MSSVLQKVKNPVYYRHVMSAVYSRVPLLLCLLLLACGSDTQHPDVLLILIDTVRADHLGCYGYHRDTSPTIDSLAAAGTRWARVQAQSPWTLPAMATIMTGLNHRAHKAGLWENRFYGLDSSLPLLPEFFKREGYQTAAFFNVLFMSEDFGFHRGYDYFDCENSGLGLTIRDARQTVDDVLEWLQTERDENRPLFLAVHFYDPHMPYDPESPFDTIFTDPTYNGPFDCLWGGRTDVADVNNGDIAVDSTDLANLIDLYDGEIAFTDYELNRLFRELRRTGKSENTLVVVMADHGEEFFDHGGVGHGHTLYQELLNVPLIVSGPGIAANIIDSTLVGQIDILPSLSSYCGMDIPELAEGTDIFNRVLTNRVLPSSMMSTTGARVTVRRDDQKVHWVQNSDISFQFDLRTDPGETTVLEALDSTLVDEALKYWATPPVGNPLPVSEEYSVVETLKNLGYIN